jgi:GT2 family glycosyltransferase
MVSAVVLSTNKCAELLITVGKLKSLQAVLPFLMEIIVVDNASPDGSADAVSNHHPDITLIIKPQNVSVAGWNDGFAVAKYSYFLLLDDDSCILHGLPEAIQHLEDHPQVGILALNITSGPYQTDVWPWQHRRGWAHQEYTIGYFSCGAIIRKDVYHRIGGIAEGIGSYAHEFEYGLRCLDADYRIQYFQTSSVEHRTGSVYATVKKSTMMGVRNDLALVYRYFVTDRYKYLSRIVVNNLVMHFKAGHWRKIYYVWLGYAAFIKLRPKLEKTPVQKQVQDFFAVRYSNLHPVFRFITKRLNALKADVAA